MEAPVVSKVRRWTDAIAAGDIAEIIPELADFFNGDATEKVANKISFKLLQHLTHLAYKCDRSKCRFGGDLAKITNLLCSKMTAATNTKKFHSSIYHITACLLEMNYYNEAIKICNYLLPEFGLCRADETITEFEIFESVSNLWHKAAVTLLKEANIRNIDRSDLFVAVVEYESKLTKLTSPESFSQNWLTRILSHFKKATLQSDTSYREKLKDSIIRCVENGTITLTNDDKSDGTWQLICDLIPALIGKDINFQSIDSIVDNYQRYLDVFRSSITTARRYASMFLIWERLYDLLLRKFGNFRQGWVTAIEELLKDTVDAWKLVPRQVLKSYSYAAIQLLISVLNYWEECAKRKETMENVTIEMIVAILRLSKKHGDLYRTFEISECRCQAINCRVKTDIANELILTTKCLSLVARRMGSVTNDALQGLASGMVDSSLKLLRAMKDSRCDQWNLLWPTWGAAIYNMSVFCENTCPARSIELYGALSTSIVILVGVKSRTRLWGFDDPLGTILHRLASVCLKDQRYERAKRATSMNCLLSHNCPESKAYRDWANIKHRDSAKIETTVLEYLRSNEHEIPRVCVDDYDLVEVCVREIKALQESRVNLSVSIMAVLDELERLKAKPLHYAQGVQRLGYHWLNFETDLSIRRYLKKATLFYEREKSACPNFRCAYAAIKFYEFVERTREITRTTENDMKSALLALTGRAKNSEVEGSAIEYDVVPAYSAINVKMTSELESCLKQAFQRWREFIESHDRADTTDWVTRCTLHTIKIAGEYSRLYHFESLEKEAWSLTYQLANYISDSLSIIYATSRSLTGRSFDRDWIAGAAKHAVIVEKSNDPEVLEILTRYRLCLANYYYDNECYEKAEETFVRATTEPEIKFMQDFANFLLAKEIEIKYRLGRDDNDDQSAYTSIIIKCLYTLLTMDDAAENTIYGRKEKQLYDYEILLEYTNNLALRMNSLLSYREISAHLTKRLSTAQKLVTSLRVAECLKFLCYIDLSRGKLDDCEAKLQGLEHILEIEAFDVTMNSKLSPCVDYKELSSNLGDGTRHVDAVRDVGQNDASPVLRKKVFAKPDFMLHGNRCSCFKCTNTHYQYLVFSSTHIRAQLFALQRNVTVAFQHFHGAMAIKKCILMKNRTNEIADSRRKSVSPCSQRQREAIEYVMFHLDYSRFLKWSVPNMNNEVRDVAHDALELCEKYRLRHHPVYVSVNEFLFQCRFEKLFTNDDYSKFTVPDVNEMDVSRYEQLPVQDNAICVTPVREVMEKRPITLRRKKTPPFLKLEKVPIDLSGGDDDTATTPTGPAITNSSTTKTRGLRRKISDDADYASEKNGGPKVPDNSTVPGIEILGPNEDYTEVKSTSKATRKKKSVEKSQDIERIGVSDSEITKQMENCQVDAEPRTRSRKKGHALNNACSEKSSLKTIKKIDEVAELLKDMSMDKKEKGNSLVPRTSVKSQRFIDKTESTMPSKKSSVSSSALSLEVATSRENEDEHPFGRRSSARLRKTGKDTESGGGSKNSEKAIASESESDDEEILFDTRSKRRLFTAKEQNSSSTKKVVRSNSKRTARSEEG